ncbi:MAG: hypothetical protein AB1540_05255 [Bdellovibrionota bacterium]
MNGHFKIRGILAFVLSCFAIESASLCALAKADDFVRQARRLSTRIRGLPFTADDVELNQMVQRLRAGDRVGAARIAMYSAPNRLRREFLANTIRQWGAPMIKRNQDPRDVALNDGLGLIMGIVRDGRHIGEILYSDQLYGVVLDPANNQVSTLPASYANADNMGLDFSDPQRFRAVDGKVRASNRVIPATEVGGIYTADSSIDIHEAGTGRRVWEHFSSTFWRLKMDELRFAEAPYNAPVTRIRGDVDRNPLGDGVGFFLTSCKTCHGILDSLGTAFCHVVEFDDNVTRGIAYTNDTDRGDDDGDEDGLVCAPKYYRNIGVYRDTLAPAYSPSNGGWINPFTPAMNQRYGWEGPMSGTGVNSLMRALALATQTYRGMVVRAVELACPGISLDNAIIDALAADLKRQGDLRSVFERVAVLDQCLGTAL